MRTLGAAGRGVGIAFVVLTATAAAAVAQAPAEGEMSPETQAMMEAWEAAMRPGEPHALLAEMVGRWSFAGHFWMAPDAPATESSGTVERRMILDGRVLEEKVESTFMGTPFDGLGLTGFDNVSGEFWSLWMDSMSTGVAISTGSCADGRCEFQGSYNDPLLGGPKPVRMVLEHEAGREVFEMFEPAPDGGEFRSMHLVYTRVE